MREVPTLRGCRPLAYEEGFFDRAALSFLFVFFRRSLGGFFSKVSRLRMRG